MPYLTPKQIERMKKTAKEDGMRAVLSMEVKHVSGHMFVYSDDIRELIRKFTKRRQV